VISCDSTFEDVKNTITDQSLLEHEGDDVYVLNANIRVDDGATLGMCSCDHIRWLKIAGENNITIYGKIEVDGIQITSWDRKTDSVIEQNEKGSIRRAWIMLIGSEGGYIRNSEFAHLGYETEIPGRAGLSLHEDSHHLEIKDSEFHNMWFAFYSGGAYNIEVDGNEYHHNGLYALDPHSGTHSMQITNNIVHHNKGFGIICSLDCYDILVEGNEVNDNGNAGIMLSRNTHDSIVRGNNVHDHPADDGIFVSQSPNNKILDNTLTNNLRGIYVKTSTSTGNVFEGNTIEGGDYGMLFATAADGNVARDNNFEDISISEYYLTDGAGLTIDDQSFSDTRIHAGDGENAISILDSGKLAIDEKEFDTELKPYTRTMSTVSITIDSQESVAISCNLELSGLDLISQSSGSINRPRTGEQFVITATVSNPCPERQDFVALVEVRNFKGVTEHLSWQIGELSGSTRRDIGVQWMAQDAGTYELRTFAISSLDNPRIISILRTLEIDISDQ
jgi:parallel beta-helix repeat protein